MARSLAGAGLGCSIRAVLIRPGRRASIRPGRRASARRHRPARHPEHAPIRADRVEPERRCVSSEGWPPGRRGRYSLAVLPFSAVAEGLPAVPHGTGAVLATVALAAGGTLLPFTLFAYGQSRVSAEIAGAFVNLEPLVGAMAGVALFGDPAARSRRLAVPPSSRASL